MTQPDRTTPHADGLEGVIAAETQLSFIDGEAGRLVVRGHDIEAFAEKARFEDVCALLLHGEAPGGEGAARMQRSLAEGRLAAFARLRGLGRSLERADPMDALRAGSAQLPADLPAEAIVGSIAVLAAAWLRQSRGEAPIAPDPELTHAADTLRMCGAQASAAQARALDRYLVTVADHGMNASTFTARIVASTHSDAISAVVAAIGALKGPAHGGAPGPVLEMLEEIGTPERASAWIETRLAAGERIMGMGHRVYRTRDPRAAVLERAIEELGRSGAASARLALARAVEGAALDALRRRHPERVLAANVEFYTAVILDAVGLPAQMFTPTFAISRVAGWLAHYAEHRAHGRLIRPRARYTGPLPA